MQRSEQTLDVTEDLSESELAEVASTEEVVVYTSVGGRLYAVIAGYMSPEEVGRGGEGLFLLDPVELRPTKPHGEEHWVETDSPQFMLSREDFVVFGPADREPENRPQTPAEVATELLRSVAGFDRMMTPFLCATTELLAANLEHVNDPAFDVRLDSSAHKAISGARHQFRLLVRAVEPPLMHDEIELCLRVASKYELAVFHSNAGLEIRRPEEL